MANPGRQLSRMIDELARFSEEKPALTRTFLSAAMRRAGKRVAGWMREGGLTVSQDAVGNVIGRLESKSGTKETRTLLLGSHLDTVRNAGRFDGALGVLAPIVALQEIRRRGLPLPFAIEVVGFAEEEGVRFSSAYLGSKGYTGQLRSADLRLRDESGTTVAAALEQHHGRRFVPPPAAHRSSALLGYCEVHIEQGPVLEARNLAVGVVSAIAGQTRGRLTWRGQAGHAGTTPMGLRRDALAGAAECIIALEAYARTRPALVATVGIIQVVAGAPNVIPGEVAFSVDVRHPLDHERRRVLDHLLRTAARIAKRRGLQWRWEATQDNAAAPCAPELTALLQASVRRCQGRSVQLVSGAGHDGVIVSALAPVCMLFVRCRKGLSHHPDEYASPADMGVAVEVLIDFVCRLAERERNHHGPSQAAEKPNRQRQPAERP